MVVSTLGPRGWLPLSSSTCSPVQTRQVKIRDKPLCQRDLIEKCKVAIPDSGQRLSLSLKVSRLESSSKDHRKSSNLSSTELGRVTSERAH